MSSMSLTRALGVVLPLLLAGPASAESLKLEKGVPVDEAVVRLTLEPAQAAAVRKMRRRWREGSGIPSVELVLSPVQRDRIEAETKRRPTWVEAGGPERFEDESTQGDVNTAVVAGGALLVLVRFLDPLQLSAAEAKAHLEAGSFARTVKVPNLGTDGCELPTDTPEPKSARDYAATTGLTLTPAERLTLRTLLDDLVLDVAAPLPDKGFRRVRVSAPALDDDDADNSVLSFARGLGGRGGVRVETATGHGLDARERVDGAFTLLVFGDAWIGENGRLRRITHALVFRDGALLFDFMGDDRGLSCRHP